eukprot:TRINITY_DN2641_c0_g1_i3.p1 TRINITY_DN2641_c0_g1~~TRINITY_DN2641_c0_g1_i3.p1  ORF type:complete len:505 (+),score=163.31 TRINITY_DN2641_c0_g1_i3:32-1516(+)
MATSKLRRERRLQQRLQQQQQQQQQQSDQSAQQVESSSQQQSSQHVEPQQQETSQQQLRLRQQPQSKHFYYDEAEATSTNDLVTIHQQPPQNQEQEQLTTTTETTAKPPYHHRNNRNKKRSLTEDDRYHRALLEEDNPNRKEEIVHSVKEASWCWWPKAENTVQRVERVSKLKVRVIHTKSQINVALSAFVTKADKRRPNNNNKRRNKKRQRRNNDEGEDDHVDEDEQYYDQHYDQQYDQYYEAEGEEEQYYDNNNSGDSHTDAYLIEHSNNNSSSSNAERKEEEKVPEKYWVQRYVLFSLFDKGIRMDQEGWYSVTPEALAQHIASRLSCEVLVDAFCGVGGNTIQLARTCKKVIAIDIDEERLKMCQHNAKVYGVYDRIEFIHGDYLSLIPKLSANIVFLSPPWGGPEYASLDTFPLKSIKIGDVDGVELFKKTLSITSNIAYYLPRNINKSDLPSLAALTTQKACDIEENFLNFRMKAVTAYFGSLVPHSS